jgi:CubicO group peptidase (beta-lactamase class C family)
MHDRTHRGPPNRHIARARTRACARAVASCLAALALLAAPRRATAEDDPAIGLWAYRTASTPGLHGELTVARKAGTWRAAIAGVEARFELRGDEIHVDFGALQGSFRGRLVELPARAARVLEGFWIQPAGASFDRADPGGTLQGFATPLVLTPAGRDSWRATVRPLDDRFTLYLRIFRNAEGELVAAFRNPEMNLNGGASLFRVARDGDQLRLRQTPGPGAPELAIDATLVRGRGPDRLRLVWPELGRTIELARKTPAQAPHFFPRPPGAPVYAYRAPPATGDGWRTARAQDAGLDEAALARMIQKLAGADPAARRPALIHSVLVARKGKLVLEEYFFGHDRETLHDLRSAGKTFSSVMLGAAMRTGTPVGPDSKIAELLAGLAPFAHPDPRKGQITLAHLLTHTSGLACDDNDDRSPGREEALWNQRLERSFAKYTLDLPVVHAPGTRYAYCSAGINLVGSALAAATGTWLPELFDRTVARPLQFGRYHWNLDRSREGYLGGGAYLRPRDLLKLGQAYLDGGTWNGTRIVDAAWIARSTAPLVEISPTTTGLSADAFRNGYIEGAEGYSKDGYAWHVVGVRSGGKAVHEYGASGNGGQLLLVFPALELVVVFTGGNYNQGGIWNRWRHDIVGAELIPAIRN